MPEPTKIPRPFADSGDKNSIPDSSGGLGFASWQEGFPAITGTPFAQGGVAPKRADFNGIFNALSAATVWAQQGGVYAYDATTDYEVGNVVEYNNDLYKCRTANGPSSSVKAPTDTTFWSKVMTAADTAAAYLPLSGGTMTGNITFSGESPAIVVATTDSYIRINNSSYYGGASMYLNGKDRSTDAGTFSIIAYDGANRKVFAGGPDGTLTWDGKDVATIQTGTWTPILAGETTEGSLSYSTRDGNYVKIGRLVLLQCKLVVSAVSTMPTGYALIKGLPYNISSAALLPLRGIGGDSNCARKVVFAANNANNSNQLRITGINPSSIATIGQIESLKWSSTSTGADNIKFANSNPFIEFNITGCYLTSA